MEQLNFHKKKLYALIIAGIALVSMLLPWISINFFGASHSWNGFRGWGYLSLVGIIAVIVLTFLENKTENYTEEFRKYAMYGFGAIALGALLFLFRKNSIAGSPLLDVKTGVGLWLCLLAGLGGVALLFGLVRIEEKKVL
jgi:hypothetical protein